MEEGTWQWEQRKHCHIILLDPLSYVKENPRQVADKRKRLQDGLGEEKDTSPKNRSHERGL